jgi:hypothetical protein
MGLRLFSEPKDRPKWRLLKAVFRSMSIELALDEHMIFSRLFPGPPPAPLPQGSEIIAPGLIPKTCGAVSRTRLDSALVVELPALCC